ncbi:MAG: hypothetical protein ABI467_00200 [Kofleriaceae bacterium]
MEVSIRAQPQRTIIGDPVDTSGACLDEAKRHEGRDPARNCISRDPINVDLDEHDEAVPDDKSRRRIYPRVRHPPEASIGRDGLDRERQVAWLGLSATSVRGARLR